ncbi:type II toxin-antitoxin system VapB family antitoxin [Paracoccus sp. AK26]|uniref:Type II toxin-antitoxin system VapB family antitoxin n=1 Tax=Paracoccus angustae TaxID=1671480 RepID=A0ABV7UAV5_9RHOB|nr:type II toxin-antitoxin system VapB family antitoxin [Paracoccus sp. AK26]
MEERTTRDERLDDLAQTLADMLGVDKTEAMRLALQNEIERLRSTPTIDDQIATLRETVKNYGRKSTRMVHPSKKR